MVPLRKVLLQAILLACITPAVSQEKPLSPAEAAPSVDQILDRMRRHEEYQSKELKHYQAVRHYQVLYKGFDTTIAAKMDVEVNYDDASGKSFRILSLSGSKLPTYILPLLPALAIGFARLVGSPVARPAWIPKLAMGTAVLWLAAAAAMPMINNRLGQQASLRDLIRPIRHQVEASGARVCAIEVRGHGLEFYLERLVCATREQSDLVLQPTKEQEERLLSTEKFRAASLEPKGNAPVLALVRKNRYRESFQGEAWEQVGTAGDFILVKSRGASLANADTPP